MRLTTLFLFYFFMCLVSAQQNTRNDSIELYITESHSDSLQLNAYSQLISSYTYTNPARAIVLCKEMIALADSVKNDDFLAIAYKSMGNQYFLKGNYSSAMDNYLIALNLMNETGNKEKTAGLLHNIGMIYIRWENATEAMEYLLRAVDLNRKDHNLTWLINNYQAIGVIHADLLLQPDSAIYYHKLSIHQSQEMGYMQGQISSHLNIGSAYVQLGDYKKAQTEFEAALALAKKSNNMAYWGSINEKLGVVAMELEQWSVAEKWLEIAIEDFVKKQKFQELSGAYQNAAVTNFNLKKYEPAYQYLMLSRQIKDSIFSENSKIKMANLEANYLMLAKNKELEIANRDKIIAEQNLAHESTRKKMWAGISIGVALLAFMILFGWMQKRKSMQIIADKNAELAIVNEQLSESVNEKNSILNVVAHDLRAPLAKIRAITDIIALDKTIAPNAQEKLNRIENHVMASNRLIQDLLEAQREEESHKNLLHESILPSELLSKIVAEHEAAASEKEIALQVESPQLPFVTDVYRLSRIIENLVSNAIKFSPPKTTISIAAESTNNALKISITDQGPGFNENDKQLLFKKFQPLSALPTGNETSIGLGLSVVKRMVNELRGTIALKST